MSVISKSFEPLDRVAIALMLGLTLVIGLFLLQHDAVAPRVRNFSWQNQKIGAEDVSFTLTFTRPMNIKSVEENLQIDPPLAGKISWAGRRMAYTVLAPAPYGTEYQVQLNGARDQFTDKESSRVIQPFNANFRTRDRAFVYLGVEAEQGRLVLYNLTKQQKTILTPKNLVVVDFKPYPAGEKILFSAGERTNNRQGLPSYNLYTVTTGSGHQPADNFNRFLPWQTQKPEETPGKINLVLDSKDFQNLKFDLSPDGQTIVVQRVSQRNPGEFGLWILRPNTAPQPLKSEPGGDFLITPDGAAVAVAQGQGVAILPLQSEATKPMDFLPQFGMALDFAKNGAQAAMVRFNSDYTRSLFLVTNQGTQTELVRTTGSILSCQFDPLTPKLYCLLTQLLSGEEYQEQPYLAEIDLKTGQQKPLVLLPNQRNVQMSLSPDGLGLLFDQVVTGTESNSSGVNVPRTDEGEAIATSRLWLLPLMPASEQQTTAQLKPEQLPLPGFHPRWLP